MPTSVGMTMSGADSESFISPVGITWAESAKRTKALASDLQQRLAAANRQWIADLAAHKFDTGQRSAASAALLTWPTQQNMDNAMVSR